MFKRALAGWSLTLLPEAMRRGLAVHLGKPDLRFSLLQLRRFGFTPHRVLDVGAHRGEWVQVCLQVWPEASVLCIEPQQAPQKTLRQFARQNAPKVNVKQGLVGASDRGAVPFAEGALAAAC